MYSVAEVIVMKASEEVGEIASALADRLIITNDNPRFEEPEKIVNDIIED